MKPEAPDARMTALAPDLAAWLDANAEAIDATQDVASPILPRLAQAGLLRIGVPPDLGGTGGTTIEAVEAAEPDLPRVRVPQLTSGTADAAPAKSSGSARRFRNGRRS